MIGEDVRKVTIYFEKLMEKRIMEFQTNIFEGVEPPSSSKYNLIAHPSYECHAFPVCGRCRDQSARSP